MNIIIGSFVIGGAAIYLYFYLPNHAWRAASLQASVETLKFTFPRVVIALLGAAFFAELLPQDQVRALFGEGAGLGAIALAVALGPITPGGAFVSFAIGAAAMKAGASPIAALAYVTSWALFSTSKIMGYELPLLGSTSFLARLSVSWPVPFIVAGLGMLAY